MNSELEISQLCQEIVSAHRKHYEKSPTGLVEPNEDPNGNTIYHLYSDGEITFQKGGFAYRRRSEFTQKPPVLNKGQRLDMKLEIDGKNYAILTEQECSYFRGKMENLFSTL